MERLWERISECLSVHHKTLTNCYGSKLGLRGEEPATNPLRHERFPVDFTVSVYWAEGKMQAATFSESDVAIITYMSTRCHPKDNKSHTSGTLALEEGACSALCSRDLYPGQQNSTLIWQEAGGPQRPSGCGGQNNRLCSDQKSIRRRQSLRCLLI